jgi:hypothetical protein
LYTGELRFSCRHGLIGSMLFGGQRGRDHLIQLMLHMEEIG